MKWKWKRPAAFLLAAAMIFTMPGVPTFAVEAGASADDWQNREVGHALVTKLTAFAAFVGLDAIHGVRSSANESMLGLTKKEALELPMSASIPLW